MEINEIQHLAHSHALTQNAEEAKKRGNWLEVRRLTNEALSYLPLQALQKNTLSVSTISTEASLPIAHALRLLSESLWRLGLYDDARENAARAIEFARQSGNHTELIQCLSNMGSVLEKLTDFQTALQFYDQALTLAHSLNDRVNVARITGNIGLIHLHSFEYQQALTYFNQALAVNTELERKEGIARNLGNIGIVYYSLADHYTALDYYQQALEIEQQLGRTDGIVQNLNNLGTLCVQIADYTKALSYLRTSLHIHEETGSLFKGYVLSSLCLVYTRLHDFPIALEYGQLGLEAAYSMHDRYLEATIETNIANAFLGLQDYPQAEIHLQNALNIYQEIKSRDGIALVLGNLGNIHGSLGEFNQAIDSMVRAAEVFHEVGNFAGEARNLANAGLIYADERYEGFDSIRAEELLTKAIALDDICGTKAQSIEPLKKLAVIYERDDRLREALDCTKKLYQIEVEIERSEAQKQAQQFHYERKIADLEHRRELDRQEAEGKRLVIEHTLRLQRDELEKSIVRLVEKNKFLSSIITEMREVGRYARGEGSLKADELIEKIRRNIASMESLGTLELQMNDIHKEFIRHLRDIFPTLTPMEVKIAVLLRMNLTSPNIASLLFISHRTVEVHRAHIRKKMGLNATDNMYFELGKL